MGALAAGLLLAGGIVLAAGPAAATDSGQVQTGSGPTQRLTTVPPGGGSQPGAVAAHGGGLSNPHAKGVPAEAGGRQHGAAETGGERPRQR